MKKAWNLIVSETSNQFICNLSGIKLGEYKELTLLLSAFTPNEKISD